VGRDNPVLDVGLGLWSMRSTAAAPAPLPALYRELQDDARLAESLGFHSLWLSEHHFWYDGWCPSLLVAGASALAATTRLHVGTGVFLAPLHDPGHVAAVGLALERLAPGRFELGMGTGYRPDELAAFGVARSERGKRLDALLDRLADAWADGGPSIWLGGLSERALRRAGRRGLSLFLPSTMRLPQLREAIDVARAAADEAGTHLARVGMLKNAWIVDDADDEAAVRRAIGEASREYGGAWWELQGSVGFEVPELLDAQVARAAETALVGSADDLVAGLAELADAGVDLVALHVALDTTRPTYRAMMSRIAADVLPRLS
jgi:alkanesulfonate monooxygenase SsuD/methylene tetrahydromethanopterin reductase-like flavin-dependent oxidoreductase (luciferase family)